MAPAKLQGRGFHPDNRDPDSSTTLRLPWAGFTVEGCEGPVHLDERCTVEAEVPPAAALAAVNKRIFGRFQLVETYHTHGSHIPNDVKSVLSEGLPWERFVPTEWLGKHLMDKACEKLVDRFGTQHWVPFDSEGSEKLLWGVQRRSASKVEARKRELLHAGDKAAVVLPVAGVTWALVLLDHAKRTAGVYSPLRGEIADKAVMREAEAFRELLRPEGADYRLRLLDGPQLITGADAGVLVLAYLEGLLRGVPAPHFPGSAAPLLRARIAVDLLPENWDGER